SHNNYLERVGYGQDKSDGFLRSFGRSNFWIAKINGLKYTDGLKNGLKNTGGQKYPLMISCHNCQFAKSLCKCNLKITIMTSSTSSRPQKLIIPHGTIFSPL
ncbi:hypothetical protein BpHYR1_045842, partial [Brachionus plicatilis]